MQLGVEVVTAFAFSIDNFNRSKEEVDYLMQLFCEAFDGFCDRRLVDSLNKWLNAHISIKKKSSLVHQYGIKIKIIGNLSLLPANVQQVAYKVME